MKYLRHWLNPWHWSLIKHTGVHVYENCSCGKRRVRRVAPGHQPIDRGWVENGKWTPWPTVFPSAPSGVRRAKGA